MPKFLPLDGILDRPLVLPYGGKEYRFQPPTGEVEVFLAVAHQVGSLEQAGEEVPDGLRADLDALAEADPRPLAEKLLGSTLDELTADKVPGRCVRHMLRTVAQWALNDCDFEHAAVIWSLPGLTPETPAADEDSSVLEATDAPKA